MPRILSIFLALALLSCSLASLQVFLCGVSGCADAGRMECSAAGRDCSAPKDQPGGCEKDPEKSAACCFVCGPGCCCFLVPAAGFQLRVIPEEIAEKPEGTQHRYSQPFQGSVWRPPARGQASVL